MVKKSSYSVLALFCQYSHACHDEFRRALVSRGYEVRILLKLKKVDVCIWSLFVSYCMKIMCRVFSWETENKMFGIKNYQRFRKILLAAM